MEDWSGNIVAVLQTYRDTSTRYGSESWTVKTGQTLTQIARDETLKDLERLQ
jgi:cell envelope opacity-associated protein A